MSKRIIALSLILIMLILALSSCGEEPKSYTGKVVTDEVTTKEVKDEGDGTFSPFDIDTEIPEDAKKIELKESTADISFEGVSLVDTTIKISKPGTYVFSGIFDGEIYVCVSKQDKVHIILNNAKIYSVNAPAIYIESSDKTVITLAEGTENVLSDGSNYVTAAGEKPNACVYSSDDLTFNGDGSLNIMANCCNAIGTKNDLKIVSGSYSITASKNAFKGNDSVIIGGGQIKISGAKDGIKSDGENAEEGIVKILGGEINIVCSDDGIQAFNSVDVSNCRITIDAGDLAINCDNTINVAEGCIVTE